MRNLNFISKLLKHAVLIQIQDHLYSQKLLLQYKSSYRVNFSTETLLMKLVDDILNGMESKEVTALAAFDTADHNLLLVIPKSCFGIDGIPLVVDHSKYK